MVTYSYLRPVLSTATLKDGTSPSEFSLYTIVTKDGWVVCPDTVRSYSIAYQKQKMDPISTSKDVVKYSIYFSMKNNPNKVFGVPECGLSITRVDPSEFDQYRPIMGRIEPLERNQKLKIVTIDSEWTNTLNETNLFYPGNEIKTAVIGTRLTDETFVTSAGKRIMLYSTTTPKNQVPLKGSLLMDDRDNLIGIYVGTLPDAQFIDNNPNAIFVAFDSIIREVGRYSKEYVPADPLLKELESKSMETVRGEIAQRQYEESERAKIRNTEITGPNAKTSRVTFYYGPIKSFGRYSVYVDGNKKSWETYYKIENDGSHYDSYDITGPDGKYTVSKQVNDYTSTDYLKCQFSVSKNPDSVKKLFRTANTVPVYIKVIDDSNGQVVYAEELDLLPGSCVVFGNRVHRFFKP